MATLTDEFRELVTELITEFGMAATYESFKTSKKTQGIGVFQYKTIKDQDGSYVQQQTNKFFIQLPISKVDMIEPGDFIIFNRQDYVVTSSISYTLNNRQYIVYELELSQ